ncbi:hypothetical protein HELRODRAFT_165493 [Helobdella robusta]|uniref:Uncharacterized protein n=1 Tax=Helobdella robusta TaxID=6412 RepID=T1EWW8_HELRO|nr:hypothetical protein HELRODRAFT_165493 [Helobdella robusta]ESN91457.1 hypothetical protein HELRODRAFT_165493 [Helobdella robusta]
MREYLLTKKPYQKRLESPISISANPPTDDVDSDARDIGTADKNCEARGICDARDISEARGICDARDISEARVNCDIRGVCEARDNGEARDNHDARADVQKVWRATRRNIPKGEGQSCQQEHKGIEIPKQEHTDEIKEQEDKNDIRVKQMLKECQVKTEEKEQQPQGNFTILLAKFKNKSRVELKELRDEIEEPKNDSKLKDE